MQAQSEPREPDPDLVPGARFGPFRLVAPLGSGGSGSVWAADAEEAVEDTPAGARVALKVLHARLLPDADARARFAREGRVGLALRHPAVVATLGAGVARAGASERPWIAMELVEGRTLRDLIHELGRVPEPLLRDLAQQVALALRAIHEAGLVHRDLKPGNLIITPDQRVRVMDLGIAVDLGDEARLTQAGMFVGTLLYASPEQFGRTAPGPESDLYSLGVLLYEAATGTQPFEAPDVRGVIRRHLEQVPERAGRLDPSLSPFFEELVAWLLEKQPARRPASAAALAEVLERGEGSAWWREREQALRAASPHGELRRARPSHATVLVGRGAELELLRACVESAARGAGRVVVVEGEAGVGKSRLLEEMGDLVQERADAPLLLRSASSPAELGLGHASLGAALLEHFGLPELRRLVAAHLAETPRLAAGFLAHVTGEPLPAGEAPLALEGLATAQAALVRGLTSRQAVVWLIEDLHFASVEARTLTLALARLAPSQRLAVVVTSRPRAVPELELLARLAGAERIVLGRLSPAEVVKLVASALGSDVVADRIGGKIARKSDGNPFFIVEMLREMKERGLLRQDEEGGWRASGDTAALDVPSSVRDFLHGRLRDLRDEDRALLDVAAVIGFHFDPDLIARVLGRKRLEVLQALAALARRSGVVQPTGAGFQFDHHQLQEVVYQGIPPLLRAEYHALLADAWRDRAGLVATTPEDMPPDAACLLAGHLLRGGRGREGAALAPRAMAELAARSELEAAVELGGLAMPALGADDDALRCDVATALADCLTHLGRRPLELEMAELALGAARRLRDGRREALALRSLGIHLMAMADYPRALEVLERALALADEAGDRATIVRAIGPLAAVLFRMGDYPRCRSVNERFARESEAIGDDVGLASALGQLGTVLSRQGDEDSALRMFERSAFIARQIGRRRLEAMALSRCGACHVTAARYADARRCLEQGGAISRELGHHLADADESLGLSYVAAGEGKLAEARERASHAAALFAEGGSRPGEAAALDSLAVVALAEGRLEEAEEHVARCLAIGRETESPLVTGFATLLESEIADARGRPDDALEACRRALAIGASLGDRTLVAHVRLELARQLVACGEAEGARAALAEELEPAWLASILRAEAGEGEAEALGVPERASWQHRVQGHLALHRVTGARAHLAAARALLEQALSHLPPAERERAWTFSPLGRACRSCEGE